MNGELSVPVDLRLAHVLLLRLSTARASMARVIYRRVEKTKSAIPAAIVKTP